MADAFPLLKRMQLIYPAWGPVTLVTGVWSKYVQPVKNRSPYHRTMCFLK